MPIDLAKEIVRQGEIRLAAITSMSIAADSRANTWCGFLVAVSVAIAGFAITNMTSARPEPGLILVGVIVSLGLFVAAAKIFHAIVPRDFFIAGGNPDILREWAWNANKWRTEAEMLDATGGRYAKSINDNKEILDISTKRVRAALWIALGSIAVGILGIFAAVFV